MLWAKNSQYRCSGQNMGCDKIVCFMRTLFAGKFVFHLFRLNLTIIVQVCS